MNDEELFARLHRADPAQRDTPADSWLDDLVEATMSTTADSTQNTQDTGRRRRWAPLVAAAAAVAFAAGGVGFALSGGDEPEPTVTRLTLAAEDPMQMCLQLSPEALAPAEQAFSGTATSVGDDKVVLTVDHWYKGGDSDLVEVIPAEAGMEALIGSVVFEEGTRYLITVGDGQVGSCGASGEYSAPLAVMFDEAFGG